MRPVLWSVARSAPSARRSTGSIEPRSRIPQSIWKPGVPWTPLAADASFRRYFRVDSAPRTVLMDAPPDKEDVRPFMAIGEFLVENGFIDA